MRDTEIMCPVCARARAHTLEMIPHFLSLSRSNKRSSVRLRLTTAAAAAIQSGEHETLKTPPSHSCRCARTRARRAVLVTSETHAILEKGTEGTKRGAEKEEKAGRRQRTTLDDLTFNLDPK